jgi:Arm DNA-binding domain
MGSFVHMAAETSNEAVGAEAGPTDTDVEVAETIMRPDLVWDDEAPGHCVRVYGNGAKSFIFVYRRDDRQHFIRIGKTPIWSLEAARDRAKKLRSILDQGDDPARYHKQNNVVPVENIIRYIAEHLQTKP